MKKIFYFAAACAALVACSKQVNDQPVSFEKGQEVTLTVAAPDQTKMSNELSGTTINFKWEEGDQIKITVGSNSALFTVNQLFDGGLKASFKGVMPAGGNSFDVQFPAEDPDIASQAYSTSSPLPHNAMKFVSTGHPLDYLDINLVAVNSALKLNLYGTDQTIGKIVVSDASSNSYTLSFDPAVTLPTTEATAQPFYIIVPAGSYKFKAEVFDNAATPSLIRKFSPSSSQNFIAGHILNMPAKEVKLVVVPTGGVDLGLSVYWAETNIGANAEYEAGKYFSFGDIVGQTWNGTSFSGAGFGGIDLTGKLDANLNLLPAYDAAVQLVGNGWRMPTGDEVNELMNNCTKVWTNDYNQTGVKGRTFSNNGETIFFPACGHGFSNMGMWGTTTGNFWSCSKIDKDIDQSWTVLITESDSGTKTMSASHEWGCPIRPVHDKEQ